MNLGGIELELVSDGLFGLDGGAMFGVVPRTLWERRMPPDDRNRIRLALNCWLVRAAGRTLLVETGAGDKWDARRRDIYALDGAGRLLEQLAARGVTPEQVDFVINTHLHFDHCGWNTRRAGDRVVPTFPRARYVVQRGELEHARQPTERDRASYLPENFEPVAAAGQWWEVEGEVELVPGVRVVPVPGHTRDMQCVLLEGSRLRACILADLVPTTAHLPYAWIMAYDLYPMLTLYNRKRWLPRLAREGWLCLFVHDPVTPAATLEERDGQWVAQPVALEAAGAG
jgi:glyoxylase-like metal-dependent hydrolase (beta-lactamase superfamily II)